MNLNIQNRKPLLLKLLIFIVWCCFVADTQGQTNELPFTELDLSSMNDFDSPSENWVLAGSVFMDFYTDHDVWPESGSGILVNTNQGDNPQDIFTEWEHGDLDLELEFMMAKNSNSGIYFQGRYELQMLDSWGVQNPAYYDMGGVYSWLDESEGRGGIPPRINASRAPGLWQHLSIKFRAPRFDENGEKIAHARLAEVKLNGVLIHRNVNLTQPTGGSVSADESETGPLRFQGDHGPVAFRNIRYKIYDNDPLQIQNLTYRYFEGEFESASDVAEADHSEEGTLEILNLNPIRGSGEFGVIYRGELQVDVPGDYLFDLRSDGGNRLTINGDVLGEADDGNRRGDATPVTISLDEGNHPIEVIYFRGARGGQPALGLMAEGPGINRHNLHETGSMPVSREQIPYLVEPVREPVVMHGFMDMGTRVHTHTAAVGYPGGINFAFDQNSGSLMKIWKGDFLDASTMWLGRGGGNLSLNEDGAISLGGEPSLAFLQHADYTWPDSLQDGVDYQFNSYRFDEDRDLKFSYQFGQTQVEEQIIPGNEGRELIRKMTLKTNESNESLYLRIAAGNSIRELPNQLFDIDDSTFFIRIESENQTDIIVRNVANGQELVVPMEAEDEISFSYSYIW